MTSSRAASAVVLAATLLAPALCSAHLGTDAGQHHGAMASLFAGFAHPLGGLDHLAAMLVLGVWSTLTARRVWIAPLAFAATLALGAGLGASGAFPAGLLPAVEPMIAASLLVLGLLLAGHARLPAAAGAAVAALFALFHGAAHGQEFGGHEAVFAVTGMAGATALLHTAGIGIGLLMRHREAWLPRLVGAAVATFGVVLLGLLA